LEEIKISWEDLSFSDLSKYIYLDSIFKETLRFYPPAPGIVSRISVEDHYIGEYFIKKGENLSTAFMANNFNPKVYSEPF
jgi:cytochrome P450